MSKMDSLPSQGSTSLAKIRSICDSVLWRPVFRLSALKSRQVLKTVAKVFRSGQLCRLDLQPMDARIDATGDLRTQVVTLLACFLEGHFRVAADGNALLLAHPGEAEVPLLGPFAGDEQHQAVSIVEGVGFSGGLGLPDDCIC